MKIIFLAEKMMLGFGVSVVITEITKELKKLNFDVTVGCQDFDSNFPEIKILHLPPHKIFQHVKDTKYDFIVAHTSPYFELLPSLRRYAKVIAWEHGDASPKFFPQGMKKRQRIIDHKKVMCTTTLMEQSRSANSLHLKYKGPMRRSSTMGQTTLIQFATQESIKQEMSH